MNSGVSIFSVCHPIRRERDIKWATGAGARSFFAPLGEWVKEHLAALRNVGVQCLGLHHRSPMALLGLVLYLHPGVQHASAVHRRGAKVHRAACACSTRMCKCSQRRSLEARKGPRSGLRMQCASVHAMSTHCVHAEHTFKCSVQALSVSVYVWRACTCMLLPNTCKTQCLCLLQVAPSRDGDCQCQFSTLMPTFCACKIGLI